MTVEFLHPTRAASALTRQRKLVPRRDSELPIRVSKVHLDRLHGDEEGLGDLPVRFARGRALDDATLARSQRVDADLRLAADADAARRQLVSRTLAQGDGAALVRDRERLAQWLARSCSVAASSQRRAQIDQRPCVIDPPRRAAEQLRRLVEQREAGVAAGDEPVDAEHVADATRGSPLPRDGERSSELFLRARRVAELVADQRSAYAPVEPDERVVREAGEPFAPGVEIVE